VAYLTFDEVAEAVGGARRLLTAVMVGSHGDTAESHPFFDRQLAVAAREVDVELARGGYAVPLDALTDPKVKNAALGILIGLLSETSSAREQWMIDLEAAGIAYLKRIGDRDGVTVLGATEDAAEERGEIFGSDPPTPLFALGDPYSGVNEVYGSLGPSRRRWR
jgi:hypothetical protein